MPPDQLSKSGSDEDDAASVEHPSDEIDPDIENDGPGQEEHIGKMGTHLGTHPSFKVINTTCVLQ